jgi:hypothetical protein
MIWRRAAFTDQERAWLRKNLGIQRNRPDVARASRPNLLKWVPFQDGVAPVIRVTLNEEYDTQASRDLARRRNRPALAPHGLFRKLAHGNHFQAVEFLSSFGPLRLGESDPNLGSGSFWLDLRDFWAKHARFVATADLWQVRNYGPLLRQAWKRLKERINEIDAAAAEPFASTMIVDWERVGLRVRREEMDFEGEDIGLPWRWETQTFLDRLESSTDEQLRLWAVAAVSRELHLNAAGEIWWRYEGPANGDRFMPELRGGDLWNAIWMLLAQDTSGSGAWRVCPHCNKIFYPPRKDRLYCTPRLQELASKREWARRHRSTVE